MSRPRILEADVDEVLLRRLREGDAFAEKLLRSVAEQVSGGVPTRFIGIRVEPQARHVAPVGTSRRTIDLLAAVEIEGRRGHREVARLLIENKLNSAFTPDQPQCYVASAAAMTRARRPAVAVLCAPREYLRRSQHAGVFRAQISYEDVAGWLDGDDRELIEGALRRFEMPYEPHPVPEVANFHEGQRELAAAVAPELVVKAPPNTGGVRPRGSRTIYYHSDLCLPRYTFLPELRFSQQCVEMIRGKPRPSVKVMFTGWGRFLDTFRAMAAADLAGTPLHLRRAGRSLGLAQETPLLDNTKPISEQYEAALAGIYAAATLRAWMYENKMTLRRWADHVRKIEGRQDS